MNLTKIKEQFCHECGAVALLEERSADFNTEIREFACGRKIKAEGYLVTVINECGASAQLKELVRKRTKSAEAVLTFVDGLDVDTEFKNNMLAHFEFQAYASI